MSAPTVASYTCPVCGCNGADWTFRYRVGGTSPVVYDCDCGAMNYIHMPDGGLETITPRQRRSAQRDYAAQLAIVRDAFSGDDARGDE